MPGGPERMFMETRLTTPNSIYSEEDAIAMDELEDDLDIAAMEDHGFAIARDQHGDTTEACLT